MRMLSLMFLILLIGCSSPESIDLLEVTRTPTPALSPIWFEDGLCYSTHSTDGECYSRFLEVYYWTPTPQNTSDCDISSTPVNDEFCFSYYISILPTPTPVPTPIPTP